MIKFFGLRRQKMPASYSLIKVLFYLLVLKALSSALPVILEASQSEFSSVVEQAVSECKRAAQNDEDMALCVGLDRLRPEIDTKSNLTHR